MFSDPANEVLSGPPGLMISHAPAKLESVISLALAPFEGVLLHSDHQDQASGINTTFQPHGTNCTLQLYIHPLGR